MVLPMQGDQLMPGGENVVPCGALAGAPHRRRRDAALNPLKSLRKSALLEVAAHLLGQLAGVRRMVMVVGKSGDDAGPELMDLGMGELQGRDFLEVIVQQPGVVDQDLQDQGLAAGDGAALAAHDRACRELRACRLVGPGGQLDRTGRAAAAAKSLAESLAAESIRASPTAGLELTAGRAGAEIATAAKAAAPAFGGKGALKPLGKILPIIAPHHLVADAVGELLDARLQRGAALGRGEIAAFELARPDHLGERTRRRDHLLDCAATAG